MAMENLRPKRHQGERENGMRSKKCFQRKSANSLNETDNENEMGVLCREMEDWYRGEEDRSMVGAA
jgi:hypothetical protein